MLLKYGEMVKAGYDLAKVKLFGKSGSFAKLCMGELVENNGKMTKSFAGSGFGFQTIQDSLINIIMLFEHMHIPKKDKGSYNIAVDLKHTS